MLASLGCPTAEFGGEGPRWAGPGSCGFVSLLRVALNTENDLASAA